MLLVRLCVCVCVCDRTVTGLRVKYLSWKEASCRSCFVRGSLTWSQKGNRVPVENFKSGI